MKPRELEKAVKKQGCRIENGGRHTHIVTPSGYAIPYPKHGSGDICNGTLHSILKMLKAAGIVIGCLFLFYISLQGVI